MRETTWYLAGNIRSDCKEWEFYKTKLIRTQLTEVSSQEYKKRVLKNNIRLE